MGRAGAGGQMVAVRARQCGVGIRGDILVDQQCRPQQPVVDVFGFADHVAVGCFGVEQGQFGLVLGVTFGHA